MLKERSIDLGYAEKRGSYLTFYTGMKARLCSGNGCDKISFTFGFF